MKQTFWSFFIFLVILHFLVHCCFVPLGAHIQSLFFHNRFSQEWRNIATGVYDLMEQDLLQLPREQWGDRIKSLQSRFGYRIFLTTYGELKLEPWQKDQLQKGMIVSAGKTLFFYKQVGNSRILIGKGPFSDFQSSPWDFWDLYLCYWCTTLPFLALIAVAWIIPYGRKLRRISSTAIAFGNGDFNIRASLSKRSSLRPMADAFNTMADRIQQLIRSHKAFTREISRELSPPIDRMLIDLEMLESAKTPEKQGHYGRELAIDINAMEAMVAGLLDLARLDREKPDFRFAEEDLESWLPQVISASVPDNSPIDCRLSVSLPPDSCPARFEPGYLARAMDDLIQNTLRHTCKQLQILVEQQEADCCIHIDDDGPGIPEKDRKKIFEPFTRLDISRNRTSSGYGLGVAIAAKIAAWHNGTIDVGRSPLGGARFTFRWPAFDRK